MHEDGPSAHDEQASCRFRRWRELAALLLTAIAASAVLPLGASAAVRNATPGDLSSVFSAAQAGDTVLLASGNYGTFNGSLKSGAVTLKPQSGAGVTMALSLTPASNITVDGVELTNVEVGGGATKNITVRNSDIRGQTTFRTGELQNANILFDRNVHRDWNTCSNCPEGRIWLPENTNQPSGITIQNSELKGGMSDGIQNGSNGTRIINNDFHDIVDGGQTGAHIDALQLYGSKNTLIRGNHFYNVPTAIMAPDGADHETIEDNVIAAGSAGYPFAVRLWSDDGSIIRHNTFVDGSCSFNLRCGILSMSAKDDDDAGHGTIVKDNILGEVSIGRATVVDQTGNLLRDGELRGTDLRGLPSYIGPTTTYGGYALTGTSIGKSNASDGLDRGIRVGAIAQLPITPPPPVPGPPPPPAPVPPPPPASAPAPGLVASFGFNETSGDRITDGSGKSNNGTTVGSTRTARGRYGRALSFDGANDFAIVPDASTLDLTTGMTLEAWVYPTAGGSVWRTALLKETTDGLAYGLYAFTDSGVPAGFLNTGVDIGTPGSASLPRNTWSHLATTYDGTTLRLYVNGNAVAKRSVSRPMTTSAKPLKIGGNAVWGEWFKGRIDDVRVYSRPLSSQELKTDMATPA